MNRYLTAVNVDISAESKEEADAKLKAVVELISKTLNALTKRGDIKVKEEDIWEDDQETPFHITSVSRSDLEHIGYDASRVKDATMKKLADKMADAYIEQLFWDTLAIIAEYMKIPKKEKIV